MRFFRPRSAFTLIELLVVIAIIAILSVVVVLVLNPAELLRESRDANRVSDLSTIKSAIGFYTANGGTSFGNASTSYASLPDSAATSSLGDQCQGQSPTSLPSGWIYQCSSSSTYKKVDGTGWIPINFSSLSIGSPIGALPVDPLNTSSTGNYYNYVTSGSTYEVTAPLESTKYASVASTDGGKYSDLYEQGTILTLAPLDYTGGGPGGTAPTVVACSSTYKGSSGTTLTLNYSPTTGNTLVVGYYDSLNDFTSLKLSGGANLTLDSEASGNAFGVAHYSNIPAGTTAVTLTQSFSGYGVLIACEISGAPASSTDATSTSSGPSTNGTWATGSMTTIFTKDLVFAFSADTNANGASGTGSSNCTFPSNATTGAQYTIWGGLCYKTESSAGTYTITGTGASGDNLYGIGAAYKGQ